MGRLSCFIKVGRVVTSVPFKRDTGESRVRREGVVFFENRKRPQAMDYRQSLAADQKQWILSSEPLKEPLLLLYTLTLVT